MRGLLQDFRYGVVVLTRNPGATSTVLASLALAIGLNATFFSFVNAFMHRPLHLHEADRLAAIVTRWDSQGENSHSSYPDFRDLADRHPLFEGVAANFYTAVGIKTDDGPEVVLAQLASGSYFDVMGVPPALGRGFRLAEDTLPEGQRVAVISHRLWTSRFNARRSIVGETLLVNSQPYTIVGVAAKGFVGPRAMFATDVWVPLSLVHHVLPFPITIENRGSTWLIVTGRMKRGVTLSQAEAAAESLAAALAEEDPETSRGKHFRLFPIDAMRIGLKDPVQREARAASALLLGFAAVVLLVACLNVASIQLARAWDRRREIALRLSLGATRARVIRQLATEMLLLTSAGGALGLLLAVWTVDVLLRWQPAIVELPITLEVPFDWRVFAFTAALSLGSAIAAGVLPAAFGVRRDLFGALRDTVSAGRPRSRSRLRQGLVVAQVALSALLLVGGGLAILGARNAGGIDPGFDLTRALIVPVDLGFGQYDESAGRRFFLDARDRIARIPGVRAAALALDVPLGQMHIRNQVRIDGYAAAPNEDMALRFNAVGPEYFDTLRIPIVRGRSIDDRDRGDTQAVAVVSEAFVARYFGGRDPIQRTFDGAGRRWSIVGVMRDSRYDRLDEPFQPYFCVPASQLAYAARLMLIIQARPGIEPATLAPEVSREIHGMDPNLPVGRMLTGPEFLLQPLRDASGGAPGLIWGPGLLALILAMVGLYGLVAYSVSQRTTELGIRMALGAQPPEVARLVVRQAVGLMLAGCVIGLVAALAGARVLAGEFYQVRPFEPLVFGVVPALLVLCGALACYGPVRRAVRLDPMRALRCE
jgi:macrolide transport system ATP-binding/permease protein